MESSRTTACRLLVRAVTSPHHARQHLERLQLVAEKVPADVCGECADLEERVRGEAGGGELGDREARDRLEGVGDFVRYDLRVAPGAVGADEAIGAGVE